MSNSQRYPSIPANKLALPEGLEEGIRGSIEGSEGTDGSGGVGGSEHRGRVTNRLDGEGACERGAGDGDCGTVGSSGDGGPDARVLFAFDGMCLPLLRAPLSRIFRYE